MFLLYKRLLSLFHVTSPASNQDLRLSGVQHSEKSQISPCPFLYSASTTAALDWGTLSERCTTRCHDNVTSSPPSVAGDCSVAGRERK